MDDDDDEDELEEHVFWKPEILQFTALNGQEARDILRGWMDPEPTDREIARLGL